MTSSDASDDRRRELFEAIEAGDRAAVERRLEQTPALADAVGPLGVGALLHALYHGQSAVAEAIAERTTEVGVPELAALGRADALAEALAADPHAAARRSADGFTPLHLAAFFGHRRSVAVLVAAGADVDAIADNPTRVRPLHAAMVRADAEIVDALLVAGADPNARQPGGYTPLHSAFRRGACVERLLEAGADRDARADDGRRPAEMAEPRSSDG